MAHSSQYQIRESVLSIETEVGKLLDLAEMLKTAGNEVLSAKISIQAHKLLQAAVAIRIASAD